MDLKDLLKNIFEYVNKYKIEILWGVKYDN